MRENQIKVNLSNLFLNSVSPPKGVVNVQRPTTLVLDGRTLFRYTAGHV